MLDNGPAAFKLPISGNGSASLLTLPPQPNPVMVDLVDRVKLRRRAQWQQPEIWSSKSKKITVDFDVAQAVTLLPTRHVTLYKRTPEECHQARWRFTHNGRRHFLYEAIQEYLTRTEGHGSIEDRLKDWGQMETHHIKPIYLGGGSGWKNLGVLHPAVHRAVHDIIQAIARGMQPGEQREADIPGPDGKDRPKVWLEHLNCKYGPPRLVHST